MNTNRVQGLEQQKAEAQELIEQGALAIKLAKNHEFRKLILDEYCTQEAARLAHQAGDPALSKEQREDAMQMAMAGGHLRRYLSVLVQRANTANADLPRIDEALEEARLEEANIEE